MNNTEKHRALHGIAMALAPVLRDKFDFSTDDQFTAWADISFKAAAAFLAKTDPMFTAAQEQDNAEAKIAQAKAITAADLAKASAQMTVDQAQEAGT